MNKLTNREEIFSLLKDGMSIMVGGFLANGTAQTVIDYICQSEVKDLTVITNDGAFPDNGVGKLIISGKVKKLIASHIGTNPYISEKMNSGEMEVTFVPQGSLAERIRCGGNGLGGFLTPVGLGTIIEEGKQKIEVDGKEYLLELPLHADLAIIGSSVCDESGNIVYHGTSQNFNPLMAMAADIVIAEASELVKVGSIAMESIHVPNILVDKIILSK